MTATEATAAHPTVLLATAGCAVAAAAMAIAHELRRQALENERLEGELRSSRRELHESRGRILSAVDGERQRIERDLHDGAQQRLVALRVGLEVAAEVAHENPQAAVRQLDRLAADVEAILDQVRSLARGVYPPLLADHGLPDALRMAARSNWINAAMEAHGLGRYTQQIEAAVYFCCLEALQNAAKHAEATSVAITVLDRDGQLRFEVRDDGCGFKPRETRGAGLDNMRDRIVSVGGQLTIESAPGKGTRVSGSVPVGIVLLAGSVGRNAE
jgi:signal transduction histidine kinase